MRRLAGVVLLLVLGCAKEAPEKAQEPAVAKPAPPPAPILVDGSSTVGPINRAVLDLYAANLVTDIQLEISGTGGGFKKFCRKQTSINAASRPISSSETKLCDDNGVSFIELPVAFDGVAVAVPRSNTWLKSLTVAELKKMWQPSAEGSVQSWKAVRSSFPDEPLQLFGPGLDSGTFDFFTQAIVGQEGSSRSDYVASEDDNKLVGQLEAHKGGIGYFGLAYYAKNSQALRLVPIDDGVAGNGDGPIEPTRETVADGTYVPLSRPLLLYVSVKEAERKEVADFVAFYLRAARLVAPDVGYVALPRRIFELAQARLAAHKTGSVFSGEHAVVGLTIADLLEAESVAVQARSE